MNGRTRRLALQGRVGYYLQHIVQKTKEKRPRERKRRNIRPDGGRRGRRDRDLPGRQLVVSTHCHPSRVLTPFSVYISRLNEWFFFFLLFQTLSRRVLFSYRRCLFPLANGAIVGKKK